MSRKEQRELIKEKMIRTEVIRDDLVKVKSDVFIAYKTNFLKYSSGLFALTGVFIKLLVSQKDFDYIIILIIGFILSAISAISSILSSYFLLDNYNDLVNETETHLYARYEEYYDNKPYSKVSNQNIKSKNSKKIVNNFGECALIFFLLSIIFITTFITIKSFDMAKKTTETTRPNPRPYNPNLIKDESGRGGGFPQDQDKTQSNNNGIVKK